MQDQAPRGTILLTGGMGYIGSHVCIELMNAGYDVEIIDSLATSHASTLALLKQVTAGTQRSVRLHILDLSYEQALTSLLAKLDVQAVIHLANFKSVAESVADPLRYYGNNVGSLFTLLRAMAHNNLHNIIFSSSATVYGMPESPCIKESFALKPCTPYGRSKWMSENVLIDLHAADSRWQIANLRYFNPVGAHPSGLIGEQIEGSPNNLFPLLAQVLLGQRTALDVFGADYATRDGTGERDYVHVSDVARAHVAALPHVIKPTSGEAPLVLNLGTGKGHTVLEVIKTFERVAQTSIPYRVVQRRAGDLDRYYADPTLAKRVLNWQAEYDLEHMCRHTWNWLQARFNLTKKQKTTDKVGCN